MLKQRDFFTRVEDLEKRVRNLEIEKSKLNATITILEAKLFTHMHPPLFKRGQRVVVIFDDARIKGRILSDEIFSMETDPKWTYMVKLETSPAYPRSSNIIGEERMYVDPEAAPMATGPEM